MVAGCQQHRQLTIHPQTCRTCNAPTSDGRLVNHYVFSSPRISTHNTVCIAWLGANYNGCHFSQR
jgi:hypothetical protein